MNEIREAFLSDQEMDDFLNIRHELECGCCFKDISHLVDEKLKKRVLENRKKMIFESVVCDECVADENCNRVSFRTHPHTELGKSWALKKHLDYIKFLRNEELA